MLSTDLNSKIPQLLRKYERLNITLHQTQSHYFITSELSGQIVDIIAKSNGESKLFISDTADLSGTTWMRGSDQVIFPFFGGNGLGQDVRLIDGKMHGDIREQQLSIIHNDQTSIAYRGCSACGQEMTIEHRFHENTVTTISTVNAKSSQKPHQFGFHTYFKADPASKYLVSCTTGTSARSINCYDNMSVDEMSLTEVEPSRINRIFPITSPLPTDLIKVIITRNGTPHIDIISANLRDVVIWNPDKEKQPEIPQLAKAQYDQFFCVEAVNVTRPVLNAQYQRTLILH